MLDRRPPDILLTIPRTQRPGKSIFDRAYDILNALSTIGAYIVGGYLTSVIAKNIFGGDTSIEFFLRCVCGLTVGCFIGQMVAYVRMIGKS